MGVETISFFIACVTNEIDTYLILESLLLVLHTHTQTKTSRNSRYISDCGLAGKWAR
jgi:hypothetical protein